MMEKIKLRWKICLMQKQLHIIQDMLIDNSKILSNINRTHPLGVVSTCIYRNEVALKRLDRCKGLCNVNNFSDFKIYYQQFLYDYNQLVADTRELSKYVNTLGDEEK